MSEMAPKSDRKARAITAGLSAVGATAGLAGLAYGAHDMRAAVKLGTKIPLRAKALVPLEVAGLGGEASATTILGGDAKKQKKGQAMTSTGGTRQSGQANAVGKRMTTGLPAEEIAKGAVSTRAGRAVVQALGTPKHPTRLGAVSPKKAGATAAITGATGVGALVLRKKGAVTKASSDRQNSLGRFATATAFPGIHGALVARQGHVAPAVGWELGTSAVTGGIGGGVGSMIAADRGHMRPVKGSSKRKRKVAKARRADPEMDRQRRIGAAAGLAGGGAIVAGNEARHHLDVHRKPGSGDIGVLVKTPPGVKGARNPLARVRGGKAGAAIGATAALAGLSGAAVAHGVSERNKSWN